MSFGSMTTSQDAPLILIVDDDQVIRLLLRNAMLAEGYRVAEVTDGRQCLNAYDRLQPDLILLDAVMPVMDGFHCSQYLSEISSNNCAISLPLPDIGYTLFDTKPISYQRTPILMITNLDDPTSIDRAFKAGVSDYVTKPIHWAVLRQRVRRLLQQAQLCKQLEAANQTLLQLANLDGLTGCANRRCFDEYLYTQWLDLAESQSPLSLILADIDYFKIYNDNYGHPVGDNCLQAVAAALSRSVPKNQHLVARYGGEEFAVIMPHTDINGAIEIAEAIQSAVRGLKIIHPQSVISPYVTLSLGVATTIPNLDSSPIALIIAADQALYQAKAEGRDRLISKQAIC
jgi:diguanylate cyclase (GGDEF)-like protein